MKKNKKAQRAKNNKKIENKKMNMKKIIFTIIIAVFAVLFMSAGTILVVMNNSGAALTAQEKQNMDELKEFEKTAADGLYAVVQTAKGNIFLTLHFKDTPLTCANFVGLAEGKLDAAAGKPFYDGLNFHRVIADFMIQGGDPLGNGSGGPGYQFPDEFVPTLRHDGPGVLSMANAGPGTNGSQFFITHVRTPWLDDHHTVFGKVVKGQNVVNAIAQGDKIDKLVIIRKGSEAKKFDCSQAAFDALKAKVAAKNAEKAVIAMKAVHDAAAEKIAKKWQNATKTESGLYFVVTKAANGAKPKAGQTVSVHYRGSLLENGSVFDDSAMHGPLTFQVAQGKMIKGFDEAVADMCLGEKRTVILPPELAYGERSVGNGLIPPNSYLVFEIELIKIQ